MKMQEAVEKFNAIADIAEKDGDVVYVAYGSKEENQFSGFSRGIDFGDALLIIQGLVDHFGVDPLSLIGALKQPARLAPADELIELMKKFEGEKQQ